MKATRVLSVVLLLLVGSVSFIVAAPDEGPSSADAAWRKAFKANDVEAAVACYAPDAIAWLPEAPAAKGTAAIRDGYKGFFAANKVQDVSTKEIHHETNGNRSVSWGTFSMTVLPTGAAKPVTASGRYTEVTENRGGKWVYVVDHASMDPAPAAAPAKK